MADFFKYFEAIFAKVWAFIDKVFIAIYGEDYNK